MAKLTLQQRYLRYYTTGLGYLHTTARTSKYIVLRSTDGKRFVFLGKSGAVRIGYNMNVGTTLGSSPATRRMMEFWEKEYFGN